MEREQQLDDVFVWYCEWDYFWCYREDYDGAQGTPDETLMADTPEWVDFLEYAA